MTLGKGITSDNTEEMDFDSNFIAYMYHHVRYDTHDKKCLLSEFLIWKVHFGLTQVCK